MVTTVFDIEMTVVAKFVLRSISIASVVFMQTDQNYENQGKCYYYQSKYSLQRICYVKMPNVNRKQHLDGVCVCVVNETRHNKIAHFELESDRGNDE